MKDQDIRRELILFSIIAAVGVAAGFFVSRDAAALVFFVSAAFGITFAVTMKIRMRRLKNLSCDLDQLLHGDYGVRFNNYNEGELAVLASELAKVTDTLKTQAEHLVREKRFLADSIADISHQIRTPLTALNLNLAALTFGGNTGEEIRQARQLAARMEWLIEALLKLSKLDAGTIEFASERVSLTALIKAAVQPFLIPLELRGQQLNIAQIKEETGFTGDFAWSVEAISNVLKNCMEHTKEGGTITVEGMENAIYTEISISDNGEGIREDELPHLFERFFKGKNSGSQSVGIGLALTQAIITSQNGTVHAENKREGGACFRIRIYKSVV